MYFCQLASESEHDIMACSPDFLEAASHFSLELTGGDRLIVDMQCLCCLLHFLVPLIEHNLQAARSLTALQFMGDVFILPLATCPSVTKARMGWQLSMHIMLAIPSFVLLHAYYVLLPEYATIYMPLCLCLCLCPPMLYARKPVTTMNTL